jgi:hypothetical protein
MSDQRVLGFWDFSSADSLWASMISSFSTHSLGRPALPISFIVTRGLRKIIGHKNIKKKWF